MIKELKSDCIPEAAEGIFWHPSPPEGRILQPAATLVAYAFRNLPNAPVRCKTLRTAMIGRARAGTNYAAKNLTPQVKMLLADSFWERIEIEATALHLALVKNDVTATIDVLARFRDGRLAIITVWPEDKDRLIHSSAPWAELGAGVAATADRGIIVNRVGIVWAGENGCKLEAIDPNRALGLWSDAVELSKVSQRRLLAS